MAPAYERASRERSVSMMSDRSYDSVTATEQKLNAFAEYYGIKDSRAGSYAESVSSRRLARISEVDDRTSMASEYYGGNTNYDTALVEARARTTTPAPLEPYGPAYASMAKSDTGALYDVLSYTRNVLSLFPADGNVKVNVNYRPTPPVYNYSPTHQHYHVYSPNNYYVNPPAVESKSSYEPPPPVYHHHYHYPTRRTTETTTRSYYVPVAAIARKFNVVNDTSSYGSLRDVRESSYASQRESSYAAQRESSYAGESSSRAALALRGSSVAADY